MPTFDVRLDGPRGCHIKPIISHVKPIISPEMMGHVATRAMSTLNGMIGGAGGNDVVIFVLKCETLPMAVVASRRASLGLRLCGSD